MSHTHAVYNRRILRHWLGTTAMMFGALGLGVGGYHWICGLGWVDALLNASMILTGMGPIDEMHTVSSKLFASFYALFSGVFFLTIVSVLLAPVLHRMAHRLHLELVE